MNIKNKVFSNISEGDYISIYNDKYNKEQTFILLFQLLCACYSMYINNISHNDMHSGNILIKKIPKTNIYYKIKNNVYRITTEYFIILIDYDRAYSPKLGKNKILEEFKDINQFNEIIEQKDILWTLSKCFNYFDRNTILDLLNIICKKNVQANYKYATKNYKNIYNIIKEKDDSNFFFWLNIIEQRKYLDYFNNYHIGYIKPKVFSDTLNDLETVIHKFYNLLSNINKYEKIEKEIHYDIYKI